MQYVYTSYDYIEQIDDIPIIVKWPDRRCLLRLIIFGLLLYITIATSSLKDIIQSVITMGC